MSPTSPGTTVRAAQRTRHAEQVMWIVEGSVTMTVGDETKELGAGDVVVVNRGVEHELHSAGRRHVRRGARARAARPRARPERDLVLGEQGDSLHAEK